MKNDTKIISWFLCKAKDQKAALRAKYELLFKITKEVDEHVKIYTDVHQSLMPLYQDMQIAEIEKAIIDLKEQEAIFRKQFGELMQDATNREFLSSEQGKEALDYLDREWKYFTGEAYVQESIERLNAALSLFYHVSTERAFKAKADVLGFQLDVTR